MLQQPPHRLPPPPTRSIQSSAPAASFSGEVDPVSFASVASSSGEMASDDGSYSGSRPRRQRTTVQQTFPTHSVSEGFAATSSMVGSTTSVVGLVSTQTWGRGHGRRGPSRGLTDRRLEFGQRWNVKVIGGTGIGESGAQFLIFRWDRTANADKEMLMHMYSMHRTWRGVLKKRVAQPASEPLGWWPGLYLLYVQVGMGLGSSS
ncbi:hypothetical protein Taro_033458 [Colocasia esculenta]|uniref:Uncharacterized protein n=1 Tax=Colocasia esculenta TaxID=4460 RepID=A0A843W1M1_COLES|nr:hypothetical protein [Colocasia esculenta]